MDQNVCVCVILKLQQHEKNNTLLPQMNEILKFHPRKNCNRFIIACNLCLCWVVSLLTSNYVNFQDFDFLGKIQSKTFRLKFKKFKTFDTFGET